MSDYHSRIMNIPVLESSMFGTAYYTGHKAARHAAAEIALEADRELVEARKVVAIAGKHAEANERELAEKQAEIERLRGIINGFTSWKAESRPAPTIEEERAKFETWRDKTYYNHIGQWTKFEDIIMFTTWLAAKGL